MHERVWSEGLDPSHVRKQTGDFGMIFNKTCKNTTKEVRVQWKRALTDVANILGYHSVTWSNEAKMIEEIANDVLDKLLLTPSKDSEEFVGIEDHIVNMILLLKLKSKEVRMVGIWGPLGIGKTRIARILFNRLSRHFQASVFIDRAFLSKSMEIYKRANPYDYNTKLHLQGDFLSKILGKKDIKIDHSGAMEERLKHQKVLIIIDDLEDQMVLEALVGQTHWFGCGSRIVVITEDKHFLRAHRIDHIYEVRLPSKKLALEMFCRSAFKQNHPPDGFVELASEVALRAGNLPLGLNVLGSLLRGRDKEDWMDMLPSLRERLNGKVMDTLRLSYDQLDNKKDELLFRHIACLFNGEKVDGIKELLAASGLDVNIGLKNLVDKSLIHVRDDTIEMHRLLEEMGKEIVRGQSDEPGGREFLVDSKDICDLLEDNDGTKKVLGISLNTYEIDELRIHAEAFRGMINLRFLIIKTKNWEKGVRWNIQEEFDHLPPKLRLLRVDEYPMRYMPSNFCPGNLVKLEMVFSNLEKLWEGVHSLSGLKHLDLFGSKKLREIPDLTMATNLETLDLGFCSSLVELPSSIQYLNKLLELNVSFCENLETLPTNINLQSLERLFISSCSKLKSFPDISTNFSTLLMCHTVIQKFPSNLRLKNPIRLMMYGAINDKPWEIMEPLAPLLTMMSPSLATLTLYGIPNLVELPCSFQNLNQLKDLAIVECINLETLPTGINLQSLDVVRFSKCLRLKSFPDISTNISELSLNLTGIEEVPWWIQKKFCRLEYLYMSDCERLISVSLNMYKLEDANFSNCGALAEVSWNDSPSKLALGTDNTHSKLPDKDSSSPPDDYFWKAKLNFVNCFKLDQEALLTKQSVFMPSMTFLGEQLPSYFTHRTTSGTSLINITSFHTSASQPFLRCRVCAMADVNYICDARIIVCCRFIDRLGNHIESSDWIHDFRTFNLMLGELSSHLVIFNCCFNLPQLNYDQMDVQFQIVGNNSEFKIKGWGIEILSESDDNTLFSGTQTGNPNTNAYICEADGSNADCETKHDQACSDKGVQTERSRKHIKV